jgi:hypothetical protein
MFKEQLAKVSSWKAAVAVLLLMGAVAMAAAAGQAGAAAFDPTATPTCARPLKFERRDFPRRPVIDNQWLPMIPGTQLTLEGRANRGGGPLPHTVTFTVTDLTKVINGVRTRVVWDVDVNEGELAETELAFFAQDDRGNVWNLGEYPEEFEDGRFIGAPSTWLAGVAGAEAGIHMVQQPRAGQSWLQGLSLDIDFLDCARVFTIRHQVCVPIKCFSPYLRTHERSPLDPEGGIQTKDHARGVGIVQVGALNDPEGETLVLTGVARLGPEALAVAREQAMKLDARGYAVSEVYGHSPPARRPPGTEPPPGTVPDQSSEGSGSAGGSPGSPVAPESRVASPKRAGKYTAKVDHPLVPLTTIRRTVFEGREGDTKLRVESRVLKRTTRVAGVRVSIVKVREFEDGELVERTADYFAQDGKGRVWYFGERVDDIENGKVIGHEGQWLAGKKGAKPGLFMPAKPTVGQVFEQERAPGVAEDRSKVVAVGLGVTTPAGRFGDCIKTRDFAPLDRKTEFKFYCAGVGLVREKPAGGRLDLVRYRSLGAPSGG